MSTRPVALVTGASRGIGRAIARRLAPTHDVVALARTAEALDALAGELAASGARCWPVVADLADPDAVARALAPRALAAAGVPRDGAIDACVLNAGVGILRPLLDLAPDEWRRMVDVNVNALYHVSRAVLPGMVARRGGRLVILGSIAGRSAFVGGACYAATKHFVMGFAESLMLEVRDAGVHVSVVSPGSVATAFSGRPDARDRTPDERPAGSLVPDDVAEAVAYVLATPPAVLVHRVEVRVLQARK